MSIWFNCCAPCPSIGHLCSDHGKNQNINTQIHLVGYQFNFIIFLKGVRGFQVNDNCLQSNYKIRLFLRTLHISIKTVSNKLKLVSIYVRFLILYEKMVAVDLHFQMEWKYDAAQSWLPGTNTIFIYSTNSPFYFLVQALNLMILPQKGRICRRILENNFNVHP